MAVTAKDVKELREKTGAGMMDCKKALTATDGNMDEAVEWLRKNGLSKAEKKADRIAAEGVVAVDIDADGKKAAIVEVNSETDFVAKNEKFQAYVASVAELAKNTDAKTIEEFLAAPIADGSKSLEEQNKEMIAVIGENLKIRRFEKIITEGTIVSYIHAGGKIGVLVEADTDSDSDAVKACLEMIAMQIASMNPQYVSRDEISDEKLAKEKEIVIDSAISDPATLPKPLLNALFDEALENNKFIDEDKKNYEEQKKNKFLFNFLSPAAVQTLRDLAATHKAEYLENKIFAGLVEGRFAKQLKEICLVDSAYVFGEDSKQSVGNYVESVAKENNCKIAIKSFVRFETGEGIEKKSEDFAAEVAAQMK